MSSNDDQFDDGLENFDEVAVDEFGNDIEPGEETFAEEDWESYDEQDEDVADDQPPPRTGKKSGNFNKIVIGVAVLVGAGVLVFQLSRSPAPVPVPAPTPVASSAPAAPAPNPPPVDNQVAPEGGFLTNPENMTALEQDIAKTYGETEIAVYGEEGAENVAPADNAVAPPMPTAMTQEEPASPTLPSAPALVADSPPPVPVGLDDLAPALPVPVTDSAAIAPAAEPAIRMPSASDVLLKQPIKTTPVEQIVVAPETAPAPPSEQSGELDLILSRLDQLESEVKSLKGQNESLSAALARETAEAEKPPVKSAPAPKEETIEEAPQPKPQILGSTAPDPAPKPAAATPQKSSGQWILKGAQPGRAMVSRPGENEMRTVEIGDTLPGIGRITGISYQGGRWLVQGTLGRIAQ